MVECKRKRLILYGFLLLFLIVFSSVKVSAFTPVNEKGSAKLPMYKQAEEPWASIPYEYEPGRTVGKGGCGVCSLAMILSGLTGQDVTPKDVVDYINEIGINTYNTVQGDDVPGLAEKIAQKYGVNQELLGLDDAKIKQAVADKKLIWFSTGANGIYTGGGHYMLCYGGRDEIVKATRKIAEQVKQGKIDVDEINEKMVSDNLYTAGEPDPDLVIRTSGEIRLSGFLPWQSVYSELLFVNKNWPDFTENDLDEAIIEYQKRTRKFGAN